MNKIRPRKLFAGCFWLVILVVAVTACDPGVNEQELIKGARGYIEDRDYNAAVLELKNVLQENSDNAEARYLLGQIYLRLGDAENAEKELQRAVEGGWDEPSAQLLLAEALLRQAEFQLVLDHMPIKDAYPSTIRADLLGIHAAAHAGLGSPDKAAQTLAAGQSVSPDAFWVLYSLIKQQANAGDLTAAGKTVAHALKVYPDSQELWLLKAGIAEKTGNAAESRAALQRTIDLEPQKNISLWGRRARLAQAQSLLKEQDYANAKAAIAPILARSAGDPLANYTSGLIAFRQGQFDAAEEHLLKVLKVAPEHRPSLLLSGSLNFIRKDFERAAYYLEKAVAADADKLDAQVLLGKTYLALEQYEEAEDRFKQASAIAGDSAELRALIGIARLRGGDTQTGIRDLEIVAESAPADAAIHGELVMAYLSAGDTQRAIDKLESALPQGDKQHDTEALLILAYLRAGDYDKAIDLANKLSQQLPDNPLPHIAIGMASEGIKDYARARRSYDKALSLKPDDVPSLLGHARLDMNEGELDRARERYQAVLTLQPKHTEALVSLAYIVDKLGDTEQAVGLLEQASEADPGLIGPRMNLSNHYLRQGNPKKALTYAEEAYRIDPENRLAMLLLGRTRLGVGDPEAQQIFKQLIAQTPEFAEGHYYLAQAQAVAGDVDAARASMATALKLRPDFTQARLVMGSLELKARNYSAALKIARQLQREHSEIAAGYLLEGKVMTARQQMNQALAAYQNAFERNPSGQIAIEISQVQQKLGNQQDANQTLLSWLDQHPDDDMVRFVLATNYMSHGQYDAAKNQFSEVLQKQPDNAAVLNNLAWLKHQSGDTGAIEMAERAHRLQPDNGAIQDTYGWLLVQSDRLEQGLLNLEQAAKKAPEIYDIRYHLAVALAKAGDEARAIQELRSILDTGLPFAERDQAEALLKQLQG